MPQANPVNIFAKLLGPAIKRQVEKARDENRRIEQMSPVQLKK
jgi:hypothetical protein